MTKADASIIAIHVLRSVKYAIEKPSILLGLMADQQQAVAGHLH